MPVRLLRCLYTRIWHYNWRMFYQWRKGVKDIGHYRHTTVLHSRRTHRLVLVMVLGLLIRWKIFRIRWVCKCGQNTTKSRLGLSCLPIKCKELAQLPAVWKWWWGTWRCTVFESIKTTIWVCKSTAPGRCSIRYPSVNNEESIFETTF